jgi:hypothetical protein
VSGVPPSLVSKGYQGSFPGSKVVRARNCTTKFYLVLRFRIGGVLRLFPIFLRGLDGEIFILPYFFLKFGNRSTHFFISVVSMKPKVFYVPPCCT